MLAGDGKRWLGRNAATNKAIIRAYHQPLGGGAEKDASADTWPPDAKVHMTDFCGSGIDVVREGVCRYCSAFTDARTTMGHLVAEAAAAFCTGRRPIAAAGDTARLLPRARRSRWPTWV